MSAASSIFANLAPVLARSQLCPISLSCSCSLWSALCFFSFLKRWHSRVPIPAAVGFWGGIGKAHLLLLTVAQSPFGAPEGERNIRIWFTLSVALEGEKYRDREAPPDPAHTCDTMRLQGTCQCWFSYLTASFALTRMRRH